MLMLALLAIGAAGCTPTPTIEGVTAINEVFGDGSKMSAAVISFTGDVDGTRLDPSCFSAEGKEIVNVYASTTGEKGDVADKGKYVVIELNAGTVIKPVPQPQGRLEGPKLGGAAGGPQGGGGPQLGGPKPGSGPTPKPEPSYVDTLLIEQTQPIYGANGGEIAPPAEKLQAITSRTLIADDFKQLTFHDEATGIDLRYNLYEPANLEEGKTYPMVLFMHDASGSSKKNHRLPLLQGNGATTWASPEWQAKHPCYVLAPKFDQVTVNDAFESTDDLEACLNLVENIIANYQVDADRVYTTGQSMGCMMSYEFMVRRPNLFASAMLVAGQWNPATIAPLAKKNLWLLSCIGDVKSSEGVAAAIKVWTKNGAKVVEQEWPLESAPEQDKALVEGMLSEGGNIHFSHFTGGSHNNTWRVAYYLDAVKEWLFEQTR